MTVDRDISECGSALETLVAGAREEIVLIAPFLKAQVLRRLLLSVQQTAHLTIVTRWRPDEVACGVSDLEAWDIVRHRGETSFLLCQRLHAKYYRGDGTCLVGSANLTQRALGWCSGSNLELLVEQEFVSSGPLGRFERQVKGYSVPASEALRNLVLDAAENLRVLQPVAQDDDSSECVESSSVPWLPWSRDPGALWRLYRQGRDSMPITAADAAAVDLAYLGPPSGLSSDEFARYVRAVLFQVPIVSELDEFLLEPRRFGAVTAFLASRGVAESEERTLDTTWQTLMRWLMHFYPDRYERTVPRHSEVFARRT